MNLKWVLTKTDKFTLAPPLSKGLSGLIDVPHYDIIGSRTVNLQVYPLGYHLQDPGNRNAQIASLGLAHRNLVELLLCWLLGLSRGIPPGRTSTPDGTGPKSFDVESSDFSSIQHSRLANCSDFLQIIRGQQFPLKVVRSTQQRVSLSHAFLDTQLGILPGATYTVNLPNLPIERSSTPSDEARYIFIEGESPKDNFSHLPAKVTRQCGGQGGYVMVLHGGEKPHNNNNDLNDGRLTAHWTPYVESDRDKRRAESIILTVVYSLNWNTLAAEELSIRVRSGCHRLLESTYAELANLNMFDSCDENDVQLVFQAPPGHRPIIQFTSVEVRGNAKITTKTDAESSVAVRVISSASLVQPSRRSPAMDSLRWVSLEFHVCRPLDEEAIAGCDFNLVAFALKPDGCNVSSRESGSWTTPFFSERRYPPGLNCHLTITAPPGQRVVLTVHKLGVDANCNDNLQVFPLSGVERSRTLCRMDEVMHSDVMVSLAEELNIHFRSDLDHFSGGEGVSLSWEILSLCANRSFTESSGQFCFNSSDLRVPVALEVDCVFTIYAPLGFRVHLNLTELFIIDATQAERQNASENCGRNFVEVDDGDDGRTRRCGSWDAALLNSPGRGSFESADNVLKLRVKGEASPQKRVSLCANFERRVSDPKYLRCDPSEGDSTNSTELFWVSRGNQCYRVFDRALTWRAANELCLRQGGSLAIVDSKETQALLDRLLHSSPLYPDQRSFWIGATDIRYESCFEWPDESSVQYTNWFPGWANHGNYNKQPSDDADSDQDCVQVQDTFVYPSKGRGVTASFYWNDRHCQAKNSFVCQRPRSGSATASVQDLDVNCNRSVVLSSSQPSEVLHSPRFPLSYPSSHKCHFSIQLQRHSSQHNQSIELRFLEFDLEDHESCDYDYVEVTNASSPSILENSTGKICGNWNDKIKLLRFKSSDRMLVTFVSDFSHAFKGFKAEVLLVNNEDSDPNEHSDRRCESADYRFHEGHCYLVGGMPQVSWNTANAICREANSTLLNIEVDADDATNQASQLLAELLQQQQWKTYSHRSPLWFWANARKTPSDSSAQEDSNSESSSGILPPADLGKCGAIPWKTRSEGASWTWRKCVLTGGYVCQKDPVVVPPSLNSTVSSPSGVAGYLRTPTPDAPYLDNLRYTKKIVAGKGQKVFVFFESFDVEWQAQCLYDHVELALGAPYEPIRICGQKENGQTPTIVTNNTARVMDADETLQFLSSGTELRVTVQTDQSTLGSGFSLRWEVLNIHSECGSAELPVVLLVDEDGETKSFKSLRYPDMYPPSLQCHYQIQPGAVSSHRSRTQDKGRTVTVLLTFASFHVGTRIEESNTCVDDYVELNLGDGDRTLKLCGHLPEGHQVMAYQTSVMIKFVSTRGGYVGFEIKYHLFSAQQLSTVLSMDEGRSVLRPLNYPQPVPAHLNQLSVQIFSGAGHRMEFITRNYTGRHMGNLKKIIFRDPFAQFYTAPQNTSASTNVASRSRSVPDSDWDRIVYIPSGGNPSGHWSDPESNLDLTSTELVMIKSLLNGMVINYEPQDNLMIRIKVEKDENFTSAAVRELDVTDFVLPTCRPNPCFNGGRCVEEYGKNICKCRWSFTGVFCHRSPCDNGYCKNGECRMNENTRKPECTCDSFHFGERCESRRSPCEHNPCGSHGRCASVRGDTDYECSCQFPFDGRNCERHNHVIPIPLSTRMVKEPFWLGLITVGTVLLIILMVYCVKRKFADKIEKFLADEIERSKNNPPSPQATRYSVGSARPSLTPVPTSIVPANSQSLSPQPTQKERNSGSSLLNSSNPLSFEDIVKRATSSGLASKKHSLNSTSDSDCNTNSAQRKPSLLHQPSFSERPKVEKNPETVKILASLVAPSQDTKRRMSLDEFIRMSERKLQHARRSTEDTTPGDVSDVSIGSEASSMETSFMQGHQQMRPHSSIREHSFERSNSSVEDPECSGSLLARQPSTTTALHLRADSSRDGDGFTSASENEQGQKRPLRQYRLYNTRQSSQRETPTLVLSSRCGTPRGSFDAHFSLSTERDPEAPMSVAPASNSSPSKNHSAPNDNRQQQQQLAADNLETRQNASNPANEQMSYKEAKGVAFMELLHKTIAQLPQGQNESNLGTGGPASTHSLSIDRPSSPSLNKIHAASPSYEQKIFEPSNTEVSMLCLPRVQNAQPKLKTLSTDVLPLRKFSVELPMPKILITANVSSCESEAESPPRSPALAPNATSCPERCQMAVSGGGIKMCYLSPFMGGPGTADSRTISESNLSTSGYSSISSPGLSRCNSSSPMIADEMNIGAFQRAGQGHLQASPTRAPRKASHHLVPPFSNYPTHQTSNSATSATTSGRHHDASGITAPLIRSGYLLEPDDTGDSSKRRSSFGGCFASQESRQHEHYAAGLPPSHPGSRCPSRLSERALLFRSNRNSQQTTSNEESFDEEIKRELEGRYQADCNSGDARGTSRTHWIPSYSRTASSLDIPSEEPAMGRSRAPSSWSVPDSMRHDQEHNVNICNHVRTAFQLEEPRASFSHQYPEQDREIREALLQRARCKSWQPLNQNLTDQSFSTGSANIPRSPSHLEPNAQEMTGGLSSPSSTASMESVVPSKICRNASKASMGAASGQGNVTTSESDSERKHAAQMQAHRVARRLQKKQRSVDAAAGGSGTLQTDRQKLSPVVRSGQRRSPSLSPWSSIDRSAHSPRGSNQDLGGKMFICSSSSSDDEPTIDYASNYTDANRQRGTSARLMRSATVETCDCSHKHRRQRSRCSQESLSPHNQTPSGSSRNLLAQPPSLAYQKSQSFDGGYDYQPPGSEGSPHGSPSRSPSGFRALSRDASSNSGSWGSHHSLRRQCALQDNAEEMDIFGNIPDPDFYPRVQLTEGRPPPEIRAEHQFDSLVYTLDSGGPRRATSAKVATLGKIVAGGTYSNSESSVSSVDKTDLSSGKEIDVPKIEIQMPTPICESKGFEQQPGHHLLRTASPEELPTIMVQSATPVATPVLEHKAFNVKPMKTGVHSDGEMKLKGGVDVGRGKRREELGSRLYRSESQGTESSYNPAHVPKQKSYSASFDSTSDSIFEPETEAGLYDDDRIPEVSVVPPDPPGAHQRLAEEGVSVDCQRGVICIELEPPTPTSEDSPPFDPRVVAYQS
ncbi:uncharacterized protein LOC114828456 [Galendromus occidentalis]|uniref:Uncharacterized protein LOC114828456 n=1 Tax=Galendromus occidentalis TaxID=34638 RepID=A0AAJ7WIT2_9ACAR|nr:uncharacterized protein LOC114828456 [Galendromus occidentalis]